MPTSKVDRHDDATEAASGFSHISVNASTAATDDDEELIEIGAPRTSAQPESTDAAQDQGKSKHEKRVAKAAEKWDEKHPDDEDPDYSLDNLQPMPLMQKIILFILIAAVVVAGAWIFNYYTGMLG